jgi:hypothetical protein
MAVIDYLYRAAHDAIGGGFGGLLAAWVLSGKNEIVVTVLGVSFVALLGFSYFLFNRLKHREEDARSEGSDPDSDSFQSYWPLYRAS